MPDASGEQICAFIHWYAWAIPAGVICGLLVATTISDCSNIDRADVSHTSVPIPTCNAISRIV